MPDKSLMKTWRHRLRINVRALMVLVLILGCWLGWMVHRARVQREAVEAIERVGGSVTYDWIHKYGEYIPGGQPWGPRWLVSRLGVDYFGNITVVSASGASDAELLHIGELSLLEDLDLHQSSITDAGLAHLSTLTGLQRLLLDHTKVSGAGLVHIKNLNRLLVLNLDSTETDDLGLTNLKGLGRLQRLFLTDTRVSDVGLTNLKALSNLQELLLNRTMVTGAGIGDLQQALPNTNISH